MSVIFLNVWSFTISLSSPALTSLSVKTALFVCARCVCLSGCVCFYLLTLRTCCILCLCLRFRGPATVHDVMLKCLVWGRARLRNTDSTYFQSDPLLEGRMARHLVCCWCQWHFKKVENEFIRSAFFPGIFPGDFNVLAKSVDKQHQDLFAVFRCDDINI